MTLISSEILKQFVERIEQLEEEKKDIAESISDSYHALKGEGFDIKTVKNIIKLRKKRSDEREQEQTILELYMDALGM